MISALCWKWYALNLTRIVKCTPPCTNSFLLGKYGLKCMRLAIHLEVSAAHLLARYRKTTYKSNIFFPFIFDFTIL